MLYTTKKDKIIITRKDEFNIKHILECGQVFSYKKIDEQTYFVYSANKMAKVIEYADRVEIETHFIEYFINYFDLNTNYTEIKEKFVNEYPYLKNAICFGSGIRILKQDVFETIISFIVSANNNIKRIQTILFSIRETFGTNYGSYYSFPTIVELKKASIDDFKRLGTGYRAKYLYEACRQLENLDFEYLKNLPTQDLNRELLNIMGVGQKVADCIMLFAFSRGDVFPVDTWIEKVYCTYFEEEHNRQIIRKNLLNTFGNNSGYAQQYLFYYQRDTKNLKKVEK